MNQILETLYNFFLNEYVLVFVGIAWFVVLLLVSAFWIKNKRLNYTIHLEDAFEIAVQEYNKKFPLLVMTYYRKKNKKTKKQ